LLISFTFIYTLECDGQLVFEQKCLGGTLEDAGSGIQGTRDGGFILCGSKESLDGDISCTLGRHDGWLIKLDRFLNIEWQQCYGEVLTDDFLYCIDTTSDNGYILGGGIWSGGSTSNCISHGDQDYWITKTDSVGNIEWENCYGGSRRDVIYDIHQTDDYGYILCGKTNSSDGDITWNYGNDDFWILKIDQIGQIEWSKTYGGSGYETCYSIAETSDGNFVACGVAEYDSGIITGNHGSGDFWVIKIDSLGGLIWQKSLGGSSNDLASDLVTTSDGGVIIIGEVLSSDGDVSNNHGGWDCWVVKLDTNGSLVWQKTYGGSSYDSGRSIASHSDGGFMLLSAGSSNDGDATCIYGSQFWFTKIDSAANFEFQQCIGGTDFDIPLSIVSTIDSGFASIGYTYSNDGDVTGMHFPCPQPPCTDMWFVKLLNQTLSLSETSQQALISIYPNPVKNYLYVSGMNEKESIVIRNMLGSIVLQMKITETTTEVDIRSLSTGLYLIEIDKKFRKKIVVLN